MVQKSAFKAPSTDTSSFYVYKRGKFITLNLEVNLKGPAHITPTYEYLLRSN